MIQISDFIAEYAAVVSSVVAIFQFRDHRAASKVISIRQSDEFVLADGYVNLSLTNLSQRQLDIEFLGVGWGYRPWLKPWKLQVDEASGLSVFVLDGYEEVKWSKPLDPGQVVYAEESGRNDLVKPLQAFARKGFGYRVCLLLIHSQSNKDDIRSLKKRKASP